MNELKIFPWAAHLDLTSDAAVRVVSTVLLKNLDFSAKCDFHEEEAHSQFHHDERPC